jgi:hypothetical protein
MFGEKTVAEVFSELANTGKSYKITVLGDVVRLSVDGIHG